MTRLAALVSLSVLPALCGCGGSGGRYPVTGQVTFPDGEPLAEGMVICEMVVDSRIIAARGNLESDGTFSLGTNSPGDGALPGTYRVLVAARALTEGERATRPPFIDPRFEKFETSGIEFEVEPGPNELNITVEKPKGEFKPGPHVEQ